MRERFRIQARGESYKYGDDQGQELAKRDDRNRGILTGLLEPGMNDDAEIVVNRGHNVERGENRKDRMMRLDQRLEDEVLPHEACGSAECPRARA